MKYLKTYEDIKKTPKKGDYVLMNSGSNDDRIVDFIHNNVGRIKEWWDGNYDVKVMFYNVPEYFGDTVRVFHKSQIKEFAPTKEELELKLKVNKYNL